MDDFSDDDLDTLNANALQELENSAIQFTQAHKKYEPSQDDQQYDQQYDFEDDDLDDTIVQDELQQQQEQQEQQQQQQQQQQQATTTWRPAPIPASHFRPQPIVPVVRPSALLPSVSQASQQPAHPVRASPYGQIRPPPPVSRPAPSIPSRYQSSQAPRHPDPISQELAALQAQIRDLKARLTTKDGEISIVRKRLEKSRDEHERELQTLKKLTSEQISKHERSAEAAKAAQQSAAAELEFTRRDLQDELDRAKRKDGAGTPKKNVAAKSWGVADGFEDVEMAGSPSKGQRGRNAGPVASSVVEPPSRLLRTPTKGKRKRPAIDSPILPLETHSEDVVMLDNVETSGEVVRQQPLVVPRTVSLDYMKVILNHSAAHGRPLAFEYLAGFALSSRPTESLASILFQKLAVAGSPDDPMRLPIEFCEQVIQLWDECRKEGCLAPITELVSLVSLTLQLYTVDVAPYIAPSLLPVAMDSCYEVSIPRFNNSSPGDPTDDAFKNFRDNIATSKILSLLYLAALGCATSGPVGGCLSLPAVDFWSQVHPQFVLMLLSQKQPVEDFITTLRLLRTSVFPDSVGPINPDKTPEVVAQTIIDRISFNLVEVLRWNMWDTDAHKLRKVREAMVQTLAAFARSPFGLAQLARNDALMSRLVSLLHSSIDELYEGEMHYAAPGKASDAAGSLQRLVASTVLLIHLIVTRPLEGNMGEVGGKLAKATGASQKYLLALARLNFSEDLVSEETAELAHELLELAVTSEEGEELGAFFGG
ncbi:hypothetical protein F5X96DRAFT_692572 [Biscogniauxia mediterranea]|nr:hypothetical protein F5X96DRAFT_692572 [Biscogniauxia mediterranea]